MNRLNLISGRYGAKCKRSTTKPVFRRLTAVLTICLFLFQHCTPDPNQLQVAVEQLDIKASPGVKSEVIGKVNKGETLTDLGDVSPFESEISFDGRLRRAPWLKVKTAEGKQGWVFAGSIEANQLDTAWLRNKRLQCYFGKPFTDRVNTWQTSLASAAQQEQVAGIYREAVQIRNNMVQQLEHRADQDKRLDHFWLNEVMPGFIYQRSFQTGPSQLLADYRYWIGLARKSTGALDDQFFECCIKAFPRDSIESMFPVWRFQRSETLGASQLGKGIHTELLKHLDTALTTNALFNPELTTLKEAILEDILHKNTEFWQNQTLILQELDNLLATPPTCVGAAELVALQRRRVAMEKPELNGIRVDLRSKSSD
ncbi:MAG: SH3 domain-containing protein [Saprospiraceae bacterium]|nr:SH3 domain-containing protein [Saprospiraceae bacterium]